MSTLIHADIFFFISTIALVLVTIVILIAGFYVIKILRDLSEVSKRVKEESKEIIDDVHTLRNDIRQEGMKIKYVGSFVKRMLGNHFKSKKRDD